MTEDPAMDGVNWYVYCAGNPVAFVDPTGFSLEDQIKITSKNTDPIKVSISGNAVTITVYVRISGSGADNTCPGTDQTYRHLTTEAIKSEWEGNYTVLDENISVIINVADLNEGEHTTYVGQKSLKIAINDGSGRSNVSHGWFRWWSKKDPGDMNLYTSFDNGTVRSVSEFNGLVGHEFGHNLGIGDAYGEKGYRNSAPLSAAPANDKMRSNIGVVSNQDILKVLRAFQKSKFQEFPQK